MITIIIILVDFVFVSERLSIAYITNPWAPMEETTGPRRVTNKQIKNQGNNLQCFNK